MDRLSNILFLKLCLFNMWLKQNINPTQIAGYAVLPSATDLNVPPTKLLPFIDISRMIEQLTSGSTTAPGLRAFQVLNCSSHTFTSKCAGCKNWDVLHGSRQCQIPLFAIIKSVTINCLFNIRSLTTFITFFNILVPNSSQVNILLLGADVGLNLDVHSTVLHRNGRFVRG